MAIFMLFMCFLVHTPVIHAEPVPTHCGRGRFHGEKRIVGGEVSRDGEWPWLVAVMDSSQGDPAQACGGTLITPQWVVSAAHCFDERLDYSSSPADYIVRLGEHDLTDNDANHVDVAVDRIIKHTGFSPFETQNSDDISLIKLANPVQMSERVNVACLPEREERFPSSCAVAGWGKLKHGADKKSDVVRHVVLNLLESSVCEGSYPDDNINWDHVICAGDTTVGNKGTCNGDSGGPMVCYDEADKEWVLAGVVSGGELCGHKDYPGVFTHVPSFLQWIEDTMEAN